MATFPEKAVVEARRCLIDGFGVVLAGSTARGSAIVREYVRSLGEQTAEDGSQAGASILGPERLRASAARVALANGASGHAMDYDDTQLSSSPDRVFGLLTHPTVPVLAASLALGERLNVSGRAFIEAFLTGFEVECKMAEAIGARLWLGRSDPEGSEFCLFIPAEPPEDEALGDEPTDDSHAAAPIPQSITASV